MVVTKHVRIKIRLKVKRADRVINAVNTTFDVAPKGFHSVDVSDARDILLGSVLDYFVGVSKFLNLIVTGKFVSEDDGLVFFSDTLFNHGKQRVGFDIGDYLGDSLPVAFDHTHDHRLASSTTTTLALPLTADVCLVNLNLTAKRINVFSHEFAGLLEHSPSCLIGNARLPLQLFGRNARFSGTHQEYGVKPRAKRSLRFVKDSPSSGRYGMVAELATINLALGNAIMCCYLLALWAVYAVRKSYVLEELKAGTIGGKLLIEILNCVGFHVLLQSHFMPTLYHRISLLSRDNCLNYCCCSLARKGVSCG
ncbi:hypothetical protein ES703_73838 [subsurface metagenome]